jgi:hypothetical protein
LSRTSKPTSNLFKPSSFCFCRLLEFIKFVFNLVIQPKLASNGEVLSFISLPYKQKPFSNLKVSLAAKPIGLIVTDVENKLFHN